MAESILNKQYIGTSHIEEVYEGSISSYTYIAPTNGTIVVTVECTGDLTSLNYYLNDISLGFVGDAWSGSGASTALGLPIIMYLNKGDKFYITAASGSAGKIRHIRFIY